MIINPHIGEGLDGTVWRICQHINTAVPDAVLVPITRIDNFKFNTELLRHKKAVIIDYCEYGWDWDFVESGTHFFGENTKNFPQFKGEEWQKFDDWVAGLETKIYFKRELLWDDDIHKNIYPIDYPCWLPPVEPQTKEEFNSRPISVFNFWGRSNENRLLFHADIWKRCGSGGNFSVCDNIYFLQKFLEEERGEKWVTIWMPHYTRLPIEQILSVSGLSKISVAMAGAGVKTFRQSEVTTNSVMMMKGDDMAYAYPWVNGINCIKFNNYGEEIMVLENSINTNGYLYYIYLEGLKTVDKYRINNYVRNYIQPIIEETL